MTPVHYEFKTRCRLTGSLNLTHIICLVLDRHRKGNSSACKEFILALICILRTHPAARGRKRLEAPRPEPIDTSGTLRTPTPGSPCAAIVRSPSLRATSPKFIGDLEWTATSESLIDLPGCFLKSVARHRSTRKRESSWASQCKAGKRVLSFSDMSASTAMRIYLQVRRIATTSGDELRGRSH